MRLQSKLAQRDNGASEEGLPRDDARILPNLQGGHLRLHRLQNLGVRLGLDASWFYPLGLVALRFLARLARSAINRTGREDGLALEALVVRDRVRSEFVAGVAVRILLLLGPVSTVSNYRGREVRRRNLRVARTVRAADMTAARASLTAAGKQSVTLVAVPADTLARLLVDQVLAARLRRLRQLEVDLLVGTPIGHDGRVRGLLLGLGSASLTAGLLLLLGPLGRVASALLAPDVRAVGAFLGYAERDVAQVAVAPHAHADGLLGAESGALGGPPLAGGDLEAEPFAEQLGALLEELAPGDPGDAIGELVVGLGGGGGGFTGVWLASGAQTNATVIGLAQADLVG